MTICPKCKSKNVKIIIYCETNCMICNDYGYDTRNELDITPEQKSNQKVKSQFSPYKTGGKNRTN
ncbi:hypothetical protein HN587_03460 [Candidatus Woesearchaeota archaeon]|jgi:hypothetical protein|nr:hypothetical protein [Candidatus Woesearchaeota archaeon]